MEGLTSVFLWGIYAPEGMNAYLYSFIVNAGAGLATFIVLALVVGFIVCIKLQGLSFQID